MSIDMNIRPGINRKKFNQSNHFEIQGFSDDGTSHTNLLSQNCLHTNDVHPSLSIGHNQTVCHWYSTAQTYLSSPSWRYKNSQHSHLILIVRCILRLDSSGFRSSRLKVQNSKFSGWSIRLASEGVHILVDPSDTSANLESETCYQEVPEIEWRYANVTTSAFAHG